MATEPLAIPLRAEERMKGILSGDITHKVSLYADDVILYIYIALWSLYPIS
jgi:hypothetical protein